MIQDGHKYWLPCENGLCQILPAYASPAFLRIGGLKINVLVKEITEAEEHAAYEHLAELHYRGNVIHGRTARLIVRTFDPAYPAVIGFIELATPFFMNKARGRILDAPFELDGLAWDSWDIQSLRRNIHVIVRIARTVVSPEFRGFGIGSLLVRHSATFARRRWQVSGKMPYFLEISADMLKFVPFVQQAGMRYVGETDGNLTRVAKDMNYLIRRFGDGNEDTNEFQQISGIIDQQVARMKRSLQVMDEHNLNTIDLAKRLDRLSERSVLRDFHLFRGIVSLPKPTYMMGLDRYTIKFLSERIQDLNIEPPTFTPSVTLTPITDSLRVTGLTTTYLSRVRRTIATHAVQQAFDISPTDIRTTAISDLSFEVRPGDILLVDGPSGSGKTTLLETLLDRTDHRKLDIQGSVQFPRNFHPSTFKPFRSQKALIELFAVPGVREGLHYLSLAGLSEPLLYLKRFEELSKGQQYRAMLAQLLASGRNVWIADEFCANLDEITANLVAHNVQKIARHHGATVIVAASNSGPFVRSLRPDLVVRLSSSTHSSVVTGTDFIRTLRVRMRRGVGLPRLIVHPDTLLAVRSRHKRATVQLGRRRLQKQGLLILAAGDDIELVRVTSFASKRLSNLTSHDAMLDGLSDKAALEERLKTFNPDITDSTFVTLIEFVPICGEVAHRG